MYDSRCRRRSCLKHSNCAGLLWKCLDKSSHAVAGRGLVLQKQAVLRLGLAKIRI
jgi:hypothetical protein